MRRSTPSCVAATARRAAATLVLLLLAVAVRAQDEDFAAPPDPYTKGDPEAVAAAGYVTLDVRLWAGSHGTREVQEVLGAIPLLWIETEHFRIGSSLAEVAVEKDEKTRVRDELKRLKKRLPRVKDRAKTLDPWLRAHLYAQRLEELYARFQELLGVTDADFAGLADAPLEEGQPVEPRGKGPYLGMPEKFCVLLLERKSSVGRYGARWGHSGEPAPQVLNHTNNGSLGLVTCEEWFTGDWDHDTALFCHLRWFMTQNLMRAYRGFFFENSLWLMQGLGHVMSREIDERYNTLPRAPETLEETSERHDWAPSVRARVGHELYPTLAEMSLWEAVDPRPFTDHRMAWSRVDWLLAQDADDVARFLRLAKAPFDTGGQIPTREQIAAHEAAALQEVFGMTPAQADAAWVKWVGKRYPRK